MTDEQLNEIEARANAATPGPWYAVLQDDPMCMSSLCVSTIPDVDMWEEDSAVVAATLVQTPVRLAHQSARWKSNTNFIAHARQDVPELIAEIKRLRKECGEWNWPRWL